MRISDWSSDVCSSDLASYEHFIDREGLSDSFTLRADYLSPRFANLGNIDGINTTSATVTGQYSRQFTMRLTATASASYLKGRGDVGDSYRVGATGFYRLDRRWTIRAGVDYAKFPSAFSRGNGVRDRKSTRLNSSH